MNAERTHIKRSLVIVGKVDGAVNIVTLWVTFLAFMCWAFFLVQSIIGPKSWIWIPVGFILVVSLLTLYNILLESWRENFEIPWVKLLGRLVSLLRNAVAVTVMFRLVQTINIAMQTESDLTPWNALLRIVLGG